MALLGVFIHQDKIHVRKLIIMDLRGQDLIKHSTTKCINYLMLISIFKEKVELWLLLIILPLVDLIIIIGWEMVPWLWELIWNWIISSWARFRPKWNHLLDGLLKLRSLLILMDLILESILNLNFLMDKFIWVDGADHRLMVQVSNQLHLFFSPTCF